MLDDQPDSTKLIVGMKQVLRGMSDGLGPEYVLVASDADVHIIKKIQDKCEACGVAIRYVPSMEELGRQCGIEVGAACAAVLKSDEVAKEA